MINSHITSDIFTTLLSMADRCAATPIITDHMPSSTLTLTGFLPITTF